MIKRIRKVKKMGKSYYVHLLPGDVIDYKIKEGSDIDISGIVVVK